MKRKTVFIILVLIIGWIVLKLVAGGDKSSFIKLTTPQPDQVVSSPLLIEGEARGSWYFEGDFPVILTDWDGRIIAQHYATAEGEWMTEDFVPFKASLKFEKPESIAGVANRGFLILRKDNPSGLPENDDALEISVMFEEPGTIEAVLSLEEARVIAGENSECSKVGVLGSEPFHNDSTKTWWFDLERMPELEKDGCNPACIISEETKTAEVNWRCTGLLLPN